MQANRLDKRKGSSSWRQKSTGDCVTYIFTEGKNRAGVLLCYIDVWSQIPWIGHQRVKRRKRGMLLQQLVYFHQSSLCGRNEQHEVFWPFVVVSFNPASCTAIYLSGPACEAGWEELATKRKGNINSLPLENLLEVTLKALSWTEWWLIFQAAYRSK